MDRAASAGICEERDATRAIGYYWHCVRGAGGVEVRRTCVHIRDATLSVRARARLGCRWTASKGAHASVRVLRASAPIELPWRGVKKPHPLRECRRPRVVVGVRRPLTVYTSMSVDYRYSSEFGISATMLPAVF